MATTTPTTATREALAERVKETAAAVAATGAEEARLREEGRRRAAEGGWPSLLDEAMHQRDLAAAMRASSEARTADAGARDAEFQFYLAEFRAEDAIDVSTLADLLQKAVGVQQRRAERQRCFETANRGRQVPAGDCGSLPCLHDPSSGDVTAVARWLDWARKRIAEHRS
jgi:hypothetical protein